MDNHVKLCCARLGMACRTLRGTLQKLPLRTETYFSSAESPGTSECDKIAESDRDSECDQHSIYDPCVSECDPESKNSVESEDGGPDDMTGSPVTVSPVLMSDIRLLKDIYPQSNCSYRCLDSINDMEIDISFPTTILEKTTAEAWGLIHGDPVVIRLCFNQMSYLSLEGIDKIEVFQSGYTTGVLIQLKRIVEKFCKIQFQNLSNEKVQAAPEIIPLDMRLRTTSDTGQNTPSLPQDANKIPSLVQGFLVQLYIYIEQRMLTLNRNCPVCDRYHRDALFLMLKPVVCSNPACILAYHALEVMADAVVCEPQVIHLLICLTKAAVKSNRNTIIFEPYPTIVDPKNDKNILIHPGKKDYSLISNILDKLPTIKELLLYDQAELKKILQQEHELCYPLLRWIISSNRSHIVKLPANKQLTFMGTRHQFLLRNCPPLQDQQFILNKIKFGSTFAFHGSPIENWHSIIREGLIVASDTQKQINGHKYGKGIYLTPWLSMAVKYTGMNIITNPTDAQKLQSIQALEEEFINGMPERFVCITLCEVINCESLKKNVSDIWTCDQSEYVCTRFFFVYNKYVQCLDSNVSTLNPVVRREIQMMLAAEYN